jgi:hypothetical protein
VFFPYALNLINSSENDNPLNKIGFCCPFVVRLDNLKELDNK